MKIIKDNQIVIRNKDFVSIILIVITVIFFNSMTLTGIININPVNHRSGLSVNKQNGLIGGKHTIDPNDGFTKQALGKLSADKALHLNMPLWNEYEGIGVPLAAEMQSAALFPPTILQKLSNGTVIMHTLLQIIAGIGTFLFLRRLGVRRFGAVVGGLAYGLSGSFVWLTNAALNPVAFLPLLMLGVESMFSAVKKQKAGGWILFSTSLALALYSGFPETVYLYSFLPLGWAVLRFLDTEKKYRLKYTVKVVLSGVVGLLLASPILILFGLYLPDAYTGAHGGALSTYSLSNYAIPALFMPYVYGPIFGVMSTAKNMAVIDFWSNVGGYINISIASLSAFGLFSKKISRKYKILLATIVGIYLLRMYGFEPLVHALNYIPGMSLLAIYRYAMPAVLFALIVLAVFGIEELRNRYKYKNTYLYLAGGLFSLILISIKAHSLVAAIDNLVVTKFFYLSIVLGACVLVTLSMIKFIPKKLQYFAIGGLLLFETAALYVVPQLSTDTNNGLDTSSVVYLKNNLGNNRFYTLGPIEPNYGSYFGISSINNNDLPVPNNWSNYIKNKLNTNTDPILFTGTYMLDPKGPTPKQELLRNIENYKILGTKYIVTSKDIPFTENEINIYNLKLVHVDKVARIYETPGYSDYFVANNKKCLVNIRSKTEVTTNCPNDTVLIRKELFMNGWSTNLGAVKSYGDYGIFQAIHVPAGVTTIKYNYSPPYIYFAYVLFATGLSVVVGSLIIRGYKNKLRVK